MPIANSLSALGGRFPALQHRDFRIVWFGMFFASATMMFQFYAQGWFVLSLTSSVTLLGVLGVSRGTGMLIFSMYGGALADRVDRRTLLIVTQSLAFAIYAVLSVLILLDRIALWQAFVLIFLSASVESVDAPARQALLPHLVPREHIANAVALLMAAQISAFAYLPPLAGLAIETIGTGGAFAVSLLGHVVVVAALFALRVRPVSQRSADTLVRSIGQGVSYSAGQPAVLWIILFNLFIGLLGFPIISTLAPFWMRHELGLGAVGWTMMGWMWGLGTVVSSVAFSAWRLSGQFGRIFVVSAVGFALSLIAFSLTRSLPLAALAWAVNGMFFTTNIIVSASLLQMIVPAAYMGRVMSLRTISGAFNQIAAAPLGAVADGVGIDRMVPAAALLLTLLIIAPSLAVPAVRALDENVKRRLQEPQAV
ncbi:MAG: MFS transporter [Dehalococcoidia bacterium]|nr:MFS transporter [Dehalococcoidia bacterium]